MFPPRVAALVAALCLAAPAVAVAQPAQGISPEADRAAREHFTLGREAFSNGDFSTAAREFSQAYELSRRPQLLYNIGTSYERLHNWTEANAALTRYLELVPDAPDRAEVQARINVIQVELQHQAAAREAPPPPPEQTPRVVVIERPVVVEQPRPWRTAFWIAGGLTVVAGAGTLAVGLLADARYNQLATNCGTTPQGCRPDDIEDMRLRQTIVNVGIVTTSVFAAATVAAFVLDMLRPATPARTTAAPRAGVAPLPGGGLLTLEATL